jgi:hypothetical protein
MSKIKNKLPPHSVLAKYTALSDAIQHACRIISEHQKGNASVVFDIDDTIVFDDGHETPNIQIKHLLSVVKAYGFQIHLVTARESSATNIKWTRDEMRRHGIIYDSLALCPKKMRTTMDVVAKWKHDERLKHCPVILTVGDQWGDLMPLTDETDIDALDRMHNINATPWMLIKTSNGFGLKLMPAK